MIGGHEIVTDPARFPALAEMLASAFANDPALSHILPDPAKRARKLPGLFGLFLRTDAPDGFVMMSADGSAAALWRAPGKAHVPMLTMARHGPALLGAFGLALTGALSMDAAIAAHHPRTHFWYLHVLGCAPGRQNEGLGSALVRAGLAYVTESGLPALLETASEDNVRFYERLGFVVAEQWQIPRGPKFWSMLRPGGL